LLEPKTYIVLLRVLSIAKKKRAEIEHVPKIERATYAYYSALYFSKDSQALGGDTLERGSKNRHLFIVFAKLYILNSFPISSVDIYTR
jgi:hypothetical protein